MSTGRLDEVIDELRVFAAERDWGQYHDPKNLSMALASEAGELLAELRWVANEDADEFVTSAAHRGAIVDEVADVGITLLLFCERAGIDLVDAMSAKIELNRERYPADKVRGRWERPDEES